MENLSQPESPLAALHRAGGAETQRYGQIEIVSTFGQPQAEYAALHKACGMMDQPYRGFIELTGRDRLAFLNGLVTNTTYDRQAKRPVPPGTLVYSFLLNLKGRIVCDLNVLELGDRTLLELDIRLVDRIRRVLEQYVFSEQVKLRSCLGELHQLALYGPASESVLQQAATEQPQIPGAPASPSVFPVKIQDIACVAWRDNPTGQPGIHLIVPRDQAGRIWEHFVERFGSAEPGGRLLRPIGWAAFNACRIEAGRALFGIDFDGAPPETASPGRRGPPAANTAPPDSHAGVLPAETGALYPKATALNKCYIGQEIVARMHARQVVAREIVGIRMADEALPLAGAPVMDAAGDQAGIVTSSTISPILSNAAICLAFVKRPHFAIGAKLSIPAEGATRIGQVAELPFVRRGS